MDGGMTEGWRGGLSSTPLFLLFFHRRGKPFPPHSKWWTTACLSWRWPGGELHNEWLCVCVCARVGGRGGGLLLLLLRLIIKKKTTTKHCTTAVVSLKHLQSLQIRNLVKIQPFCWLCKAEKYSYIYVYIYMHTQKCICIYIFNLNVWYYIQPPVWWNSRRPPPVVLQWEPSVTQQLCIYTQWHWRNVQ